MNKIKENLLKNRANRPVDFSSTYYSKDQIDALLAGVSSGAVAWGGISGTLSAQTDLQTALNGKQASGSYAAATHTHAQSDITNLVTDLAGKASSTHTHAQSDITNLTTDLAAKQATLVSGTNIKTVNSTSLLGAGNVAVGDVTGQSSSVDNEIALFSSTTGKVIKRATTTGIVKATSGVISAATDGTDYYSSAYAIPNANIPNGINNGSRASQQQVVVAGTAYYITRSNLLLPASSKTGGGMSVGTRFLWRIGLTKTAAGTGTFQLRIYRGTNGSTADTADVTQTLGTQTAAVDNMTVDVMVTVTATGATGSYYWTMTPQNKAVTATGFGIATGTGAFFSGTVSSVALNTTSLQFGLGFISNTGTPTITIPLVHGQVFNMT